MHRAIGPDAAGRWHVAAWHHDHWLGVMDCPSEAIAQREARILSGQEYRPRHVERLHWFEMYEPDAAVRAERHDPGDSPFADPRMPF